MEILLVALIAISIPLLLLCVRKVQHYQRRNTLGSYRLLLTGETTAQAIVISWRLVLRIFSLLFLLIGLFWFVTEPSFEPLIAMFEGIATFVVSSYASVEPLERKPLETLRFISLALISIIWLISVAWLVSGVWWIGTSSFEATIVVLSTTLTGITALYAEYS